MSKDLVFLVSGGRTGTTFFGSVLGDVVADCHAVHEADVLQTRALWTWWRLRDFGLWHMVIGRLLGQAGVRVLGQRLLTGEIEAEVVRRRIKASRDRWHARVEAPLVIESHAQFWLLARDVPKMWPQAKVIGIIRDPRDWVRSFLNYGGRYDREDRVDLLPPGRLTPAKLGQTELAAEWPTWGTFEKLAWEWSVIYGHLTAAVDDNTGVRMWRFEDVFGPDRAFARDLVGYAATHGTRHYAVTGLEEALRDPINASSGAAQDWEHWTPAEAAVVQRLCGDLMARWGYGEEPAWKALVAAA